MSVPKGKTIMQGKVLAKKTQPTPPRETPKKK